MRLFFNDVGRGLNFASNYFYIRKLNFVYFWYKIKVPQYRYLVLFQKVPRYWYGTLQKYIVIATGVAKKFDGRDGGREFEKSL